MRSILFLGTMVSGPAEMAACIEALEIPSVTPAMTELPLQDILDAAAALQRKYRIRAAHLTHFMASAEVALAQNDRPNWLRAKMLLKESVGKMGPEEWKVLAHNYKRQATWADSVPLSVHPIYVPASSDSVQKTPPIPTIDVHATTVWPPNSEVIQVPLDDNWSTIKANPNVRKIFIKDISGKRILTYAHDRISGTPISFMTEQTSFLDKIRIALTDPMEGSYTLPTCLFDATTHPILTNFSRFLIRVHRHRYHDKLQDNFSYWVAYWAIPPGKKRYELIVYMDEDVSVPFKEFVRVFLYTTYDNGNEGLYVFEPIDSKKGLEEVLKAGTILFLRDGDAESEDS